jgi:DNA polymerase III subunit gamma/tau
MGLMPSTLAVGRSESSEAVTPSIPSAIRNPVPLSIAPPPIATASIATPTAIETPSISPAVTPTATASSPPAIAANPQPQPPLSSQPPATAATPITDVDDQDLELVWRSILDNLGLASTKGIISPNCYLIEVSGSTIKIGVRGRNVVPLVKAQLEKLSKACAKTLQLKSVKLNLVVTENAPPQSNAAPPNPHANLKQPENPAIVPASIPAANKPVSNSAASNPAASNPVTSNPVSNPPAPANNAAIAPSPDTASKRKAPSSNPPSSNASTSTASANADAIAAPSWTPEDPLSRAAKSLADAFNGAIVNMDETVAVDAVEDLPTAADLDFVDDTLVDDTLSED